MLVLEKGLDWTCHKQNDKVKEQCISNPLQKSLQLDNVSQKEAKCKEQIVLWSRRLCEDDGNLLKLHLQIKFNAIICQRRNGSWGRTCIEGGKVILRKCPCHLQEFLMFLPPPWFVGCYAGEKGNTDKVGMRGLHKEQRVIPSPATSSSLLVCLLSCLHDTKWSSRVSASWLC